MHTGSMCVKGENHMKDLIDRKNAIEMVEDLLNESDDPQYKLGVMSSLNRIRWVEKDKSYWSMSKELDRWFTIATTYEEIIDKFIGNNDSDNSEWVDEITTDQLKKCPNCGALMFGDFKECPECGTELTDGNSRKN